MAQSTDKVPKHTWAHRTASPHCPHPKNYHSLKQQRYQVLIRRFSHISIKFNSLSSSDLVLSTKDQRKEWLGRQTWLTVLRYGFYTAAQSKKKKERKMLTCHLALAAHRAVDVAACLPMAMEQLHCLLVNSSACRSLMRSRTNTF